MIHVIVAERVDLLVARVVAAGAGLIGLPAVFKAGRRLSVVVYVIVAERLGISALRHVAAAALSRLRAARKAGRRVILPVTPVVGKLGVRDLFHRRFGASRAFVRRRSVRVARCSRYFRYVLRKAVRRGGKARLDRFIRSNIGIAAPAVEGIVIGAIRILRLRGGRGGGRAVVHFFGFENRAVFRLEGDGVFIDRGRAYVDRGGGGDARYRIRNGVAALACAHRAVRCRHGGVRAVGVARGERHGKADAAAVVHGSGGRGVGVARAVLIERNGVAVDRGGAHADRGGGSDVGYRIRDGIAALAGRYRADGCRHILVRAVGIAGTERYRKADAAAVICFCRRRGIRISRAVFGKGHVKLIPGIIQVDHTAAVRRNRGGGDDGIPYLALFIRKSGIGLFQIGKCQRGVRGAGLVFGLFQRIRAAVQIHLVMVHLIRGVCVGGPLREERTGLRRIGGHGGAEGIGGVTPDHGAAAGGRLEIILKGVPCTGGGRRGCRILVTA